MPTWLRLNSHRQNGGSAVLAETDELIGAEQWIVKCCKDRDVSSNMSMLVDIFQVAESFLKMGDRYQKWAAWHGHSAEGNPSGQDNTSMSNSYRRE